MIGALAAILAMAATVAGTVLTYRLLHPRIGERPAALIAAAAGLAVMVAGWLTIGALGLTGAVQAYLHSGS